MEETNFNREPDVPSTQKSRSFDDKDEKIDVEDTAPVAMSPIPTRPKSWLRRMKPVHRPEKMPPVLPRFWRPFYLLSLPAIAFSGLTAGSGLCIDAVYNATVSLVFSGPPYSFRPSMVGLTFAGPLLVCHFIVVYLAGTLRAELWSLGWGHRRGAGWSRKRLDSTASSAAQWRHPRVRAPALAPGLCDDRCSGRPDHLGCRRRSWRKSPEGCALIFDTHPVDRCIGWSSSLQAR